MYSTTLVRTSYMLWVDEIFELDSSPRKVSNDRFNLRLSVA